AQLADEALDRVEHRILIADERKMIVARQLDEAAARNVLGEMAPLFERHRSISCSVNQQSRYVNHREDVPHVDLAVHSRQRQRRTWTRSHSQIGRPPLPELRIVAAAWCAGLQSEWTTPLAREILQILLSPL